MDAVVRNLASAADAPPFGSAIGALAMPLDGRATRLGQFAAGARARGAVETGRRRG